MFEAVPVSVHSLPLFLAQVQACLQKAHVHAMKCSSPCWCIPHLLDHTKLRCFEQSLRYAITDWRLELSACKHVVSQSCCALCVSLPGVYAGVREGMQCWRRLKEFRDRKIPAGEHIDEDLAWQTLYEFEEHTGATELNPEQSHPRKRRTCASIDVDMHLIITDG